MNIKHISVSRQSLYKECPQKYKYKYHLEIPEEINPFYFTFGKMVHKIAEVFVQRKGETSITEIKNDVINGKIDIGESIPKLDYGALKRLSLHVNNYVRIANKIGFEGQTEFPFKYDLDPPNGRHIVGFIDRLVFKNDNAYIFDYKTSQISPWRKDERTIQYDPQLTCYSWIIQKEFGLPAKNIKASLIYLEDAKIVTASFSEETLSEFPGKILEVYKEIEQSDPDKVFGNVGRHCKLCSYKKMCPFVKLT